MKYARLYKLLHFLYTDDVGLVIRNTDSVSLPCKLDNFARQVFIKSAPLNIDPFEYKYITFDGKALFEITDCIRSYEEFVLFIQYITDVNLGGTEPNAPAHDPDPNFFMAGTTPYTYAGLRYTLSDLNRIMGDTLKIDRKTILSKMIWGIKIEFSEIPKNINRTWRYGDNSLTGFQYTSRRDNKIYPHFKPQTNSLGYDLSLFNYNYSEKCTVIIPLPTYNINKLTFTSTDKAEFALDLKVENLYKTLISLVSDLTYSIEIVPLNFYLYALNYRTGKATGLTVSNGTYLFYNAFSAADGMSAWIDGSLASVDLDGGAMKEYYPLFICDSGIASLTQNKPAAGIGRVYSFLNTLEPPGVDQIYSTLNIFGNEIDMSNVPDWREFYIQPRSSGIRIHTCYARGNYIDINTDIEFSKDYMSNFNAYVKSNIQSDYTLKTEYARQEQEQRREMRLTSGVINIASSAQKGASAGMLVNGAVGTVAGAIAGGVSGVVDLIKNEIIGNMQDQNEIANINLAEKQAIQRASSMIVPGTQINGTVSLETFMFKNGNKWGVCYMTYAVIDSTNDIYIYNAAIKETAIDTINHYAINPDVRPQWIPPGKPWVSFFTAKIGTTRKDFYILGYRDPA